MNVAIIIAVSEYDRKDLVTDLPACKNDGSVVNTIISLSTKYDDVLVIDSATTSTSIKTQLSQFVSKHKDSGVDEVFFYFTGHGDYTDDFYFLPRDFDDKKRHRTSLSNTELDAMLRSLSPKLAVKVVDACYSGLSYVKDPNAVQKSLEASKGHFKQCYFMFSSRQDQTSAATGQYSVFTESFCRAIASYPETTIRFRDIADFVSDEFVGKDQTPAFVVQSDLTDVFCSVTDEMRAAINKALHTGLSHPAGEKSDVAHVSLLDRVKDEAVKYCTEEEAITTLTLMQQMIEQFQLSGEVGQLYDLTKGFQPDPNVPEKKAIASWLKENDQDYFVELEYETQPINFVPATPAPKNIVKLNYDDIPNAFADIFASKGYYHPLPTQYGWSAFPYSISIDYPKSPSGFSVTAKCPFVAVEIRFAPKYGNLPWWTGYIVFVFSKVVLRSFHSFIRLKERSWTERETPSDVKWKTQDVEWKRKDIGGSVAPILKEWEKAVEQYLVKRFAPPEQVAQESDQPAVKATRAETKRRPVKVPQQAAEQER